MFRSCVFLICASLLVCSINNSLVAHTPVNSSKDAKKVTAALNKKVAEVITEKNGDLDKEKEQKNKKKQGKSDDTDDEEDIDDEQVETNVVNGHSTADPMRIKMLQIMITNVLLQDTATTMAMLSLNNSNASPKENIPGAGL